MTSDIFKLNLNDFTKGLIMAFLASAVFVIYTAFTDSCGIQCVDWLNALNAGIAGAIAYLIKNYFTDHNGKLGGKI